jgi:tetratricopeptide (TPR) repeat protein
LKKKILYSFFFFLSVYQLQGQRLDSLLRRYNPAKKDTAQINLINLIANEYRNNNPDTSIYFSKLALNYSEMLDYTEGMAAAEIAIGTALTNKGEHKTAFESFDRGLALAKKCGNKKLMARAYSNSANIDVSEGNYDRALVNYNTALELRKQINDQIGVGDVSMNIGLVHDLKGEYSAALQSYAETEKIYTAANDQLSLAILYNDIAGVYKSLGKINEALGNYFKAVKISEKAGDKINIARPYANIGIIHLDQGNFTEAKENLEKALKMFIEVGNKSGIALTYNTLGIMQQRQRKLDEARQSFLKSAEILRQSNEQQGLSMAYNNIGSVYEEENRYEDAMASYMQALEIKERIEDKEGIAITYNNIGGLDNAKGDYASAVSWCKKALLIGKETGSAEVIRDANQLLFESYKHLDDPKNAFISYQQYIEYRDSLINQENTEKIVQQQMQFDFDKKESIARAEQQKKDERAQQQAQKEKLIRNVFIGGFLLVLILAVFIYKGYRDKQKANAIIEAKKLEVEHQKELVEEKQKEIIDSISYAKRLQEAILPPPAFIREQLPESFVLYKPKDIVAGDFYWMEISKEMEDGKREMGDGKRDEKNNSASISPLRSIDSGLILLAAADCTGHGVPGAMVSVVCSNALNRTVKEFGITEPGKILDKVRELVIETFEKSENEVRDGMDISLCALDKNKMELKWAGANNPLWLIRNGALTDFRPDKQPIGKMDEASPFTTQVIPLQKGDSFYLFSDGFADQFGGPKGKKFKYRQMQEILLENAASSMQQQAAALEKRLQSWQGPLEQIDDILVIGFRV